MPGRGLCAWPASTPHLACLSSRRGSPSARSKAGPLRKRGAGVEGWWGAGLLTSGLNHVVQARPGGAGAARTIYCVAETRGVRGGGI